MMILITVVLNEGAVTIEDLEKTEDPVLIVAPTRVTKGSAKIRFLVKNISEAS
jgi:hypothetical protein